MITTLALGPGNAGLWNSVTVGDDGLPVIAYEANDSLYVAKCENVACTAITPSIVESTGPDDLQASMIIGTDGLSLVSYRESSNKNFKIAHCETPSCETATTTIIEATGDVCSHSSITIGTDGLAIASYYDATNDDLKVAHCNNTACT